MVGKRVWIGVPLLGILFAARIALSLPCEMQMPGLREVRVVAGAVLQFPHAEPGAIGAVVRGVAAATRPGVDSSVEGWNAFWGEVEKTGRTMRGGGSAV